MAGRGHGRLVTALNGVVALTLVVLLAVVALVVKPPSPPGIAEFAPQASKPITKAPPGQAAQHGTGPGACAAGQVCTVVPTTTATAVALPTSTVRHGVPSALQCYEWPDGKVTQTFDPQSPPCIASWPEADKGNGGATTRGVTKAEIQVAIRQEVLSDDNTKAYLDAVVGFFNTRYQLYGRHLRIVASAADRATDPSKSHASAEAFFVTDAFAALLEAKDDSSLPHELSQGHMLSVSYERYAGRWASAAALSAEAPYAWTYAPPPDVTEQNLAAFVCTSLKGKPARFSTGQQSLARKFVILNNEGNDGGAPRNPRPLQDGLKACGLAPEVVTVTDADTDTAAQARAGQTARQLQSESVTTVLSIAGCCQQRFEQIANQNGWHPEWVYDGAGGTYPDVAEESTQTTGQDTGRLGLAPKSRTLPFEIEPHYQVAPHRHDVPGGWYTILQIVAAGAQMAGPHLTPASFASGLAATDFPNPGAAGPPSYQAAASFSADHPWMLHDYAVWWPDVPGGKSDKSGGSKGGYRLCFVDQGRRWSLGHWVDIERKIQGGLRGC